MDGLGLCPIYLERIGVCVVALREATEDIPEREERLVDAINKFQRLRQAPGRRAC